MAKDKSDIIYTYFFIVKILLQYTLFLSRKQNLNIVNTIQCLISIFTIRLDVVHKIT